jgi:hypothetical protein
MHLKHWDTQVQGQGIPCKKLPRPAWLRGTNTLLAKKGSQQSESNFASAAAFFGFRFLASLRNRGDPIWRSLPFWAQQPEGSMGRARKRACPPDLIPAEPAPAAANTTPFHVENLQ